MRPWKKWRAAVYLCKDGIEEMQPLDGVPSIEQQRVLCRHTAAALDAEVIGEFADGQFIGPRLGLQAVLELTREEQRLDYLIVSSLDRLASCVDDAFEVAWWLGFASTVVIPADGEKGFPWTGTPPPDHE